jgi:hypothetical protein
MRPPPVCPDQLETECAAPNRARLSLSGCLAAIRSKYSHGRAAPREEPLHFKKVRPGLVEDDRLVATGATFAYWADNRASAAAAAEAAHARFWLPSGPHARCQRQRNQA